MYQINPFFSSLNPVVPASFIEPPLKGIQILLIICAIMFLTLLLLGLAVSYYCLRRQTIGVVRRQLIPIGSSSEITKLSGSSGNMSNFEVINIPRVNTGVLTKTHSSTGSDEPFISDTLPSDYPSESHSEPEDMDTRSLPSAGSYENRGFVQDTSIYSEHCGHTQEFITANAVTTIESQLPMAIREPSPKFDVQVRVKRSAPPPPSPLSSDSESVTTSIRDRNNLSTIMESHEDRESVITMDSLPQEQTQFTYVPELHPAPKHVPAAPVFSKIIRKKQETHVRQSWPEDLVDGPPPPPPPAPISEIGTDIHSVNEYIDRSHLYQIEQTERLPEPPIVARKPEITSHVVDDVFLRTITEKKTIEDIERYKRLVTEYKSRPIPPDPTWDVTIRNYPDQLTDGNQKQWEDFSDVSSSSGMTLTPQMERSQFNVPPPQYINESGEKLTSPELVGNMKPIEIPPEDKAVPNWDVLIRVLEQDDLPIADDTSSVHSSNYLQRQISYDDKVKWKEIITTESTLRYVFIMHTR